MKNLFVLSIAWILWGQPMHGKTWNGDPYLYMDGFDTKKECTDAMAKVFEHNKRAKSEKVGPMCRPAGYDPNRRGQCVGGVCMQDYSLRESK